MTTLNSIERQMVQDEEDLVRIERKEDDEFRRNYPALARLHAVMYFIMCALLLVLCVFLSIFLRSEGEGISCGGGSRAG